MMKGAHLQSAECLPRSPRVLPHPHGVLLRNPVGASSYFATRWGQADKGNFW